MTPAARVSSVEALADFTAALGGFCESARDALCANEMELRRAVSWLEERTKYWQQEVRVRTEEVAVARTNLKRRQLMKIGDRPPDCTEQEKALARARERLHEAETKLASSRRWRPLLERAVEEYEGPARNLANRVEAELPKAVADLRAKVESLEAYLKLAAPPAPGPGTSAP